LANEGRHAIGFWWREYSELKQQKALLSDALATGSGDEDEARQTLDPGGHGCLGQLLVLVRGRYSSASR
jgi:hypothetical protein